MSKGGLEIADICFEHSIIFTPDDCAEMSEMNRKKAIEHALRLWQEAGDDPEVLKQILNSRRK